MANEKEDYQSELLSVDECAMHVRAKAALHDTRYHKIKVDPAKLEAALVSLDQARQQIERLEKRLEEMREGNRRLDERASQLDAENQALKWKL